MRQASLWRDAWRRYTRNKAAMVAGAVFLIVLLWALDLAAHLALRPRRAELLARLPEPEPRAPFGTDKFGRDLFTRAAIGTRVSIFIGFGATLAILLIGVVYGSISGFVGGWVDNTLMRLLDALYGLPYLPFAIITLAIIGTINAWTMVIALSIASWFTAARIVRGQIITLKQNDYIRAARAIGARWYRILGRHLLPNTLGVLIIAIFLELPGRDPRRGVPVVHRPRHQPARLLARPDGRGRPCGVSREPAHHRDPEPPDRDHRPLCQLHRGRHARRPRPAHAGDLIMPLLEVDDLRTHFFTREGAVRAVDGISF